MPPDLRKALTRTPAAATAWKSLTPIGRRDFIDWIASAKQVETRTRRIEKALDMLQNGKRRPCCYALVPMNLYKALATDPKAKARWKILTPLERRDFARWIESAKQVDTRTRRIAKTCSLLRAGAGRA